MDAAEGDPAGRSTSQVLVDRRAALGALSERRRVAQVTQGPELEARQPSVDRFARRQSGKRFIGQIEKLRMRIVVVGQTAQQLRDVVAGIKPRQVLACGPKPSHELCFGHQVERFGRFVEKDYSTMGEYVKSRLERVFQPPGALRQSPDLAEFPCEKRDNKACLAEIGDAEHQRAGFFRRHRRTK